MSPDAPIAFAAGAGVAAVAALAAFLRIRSAARSGRLGPPALLQATALRFALTLGGAVALVLVWRDRATAVLAGLGVTYLALLAIETRWSIGTVGRPQARRAAREEESE